MEFRILGRPDVYREGEWLDTGPPKQRAVLAALLLSTNQTLTTDHLREAVWGRPPSAAGANLRTYLGGLRRALQVPGERGSRLTTFRAGAYRLSVHPGERDVQRFEALADDGERLLRAGRLPAAADHLGRALGLWRGRALDGVSYGPALEPIVLRLEERRLVVAEQWAQARLALGQPDGVVTELRALVKEHPLRERLWTHLIRALCQSGHPGEALAAYAELRAVLGTELGTDPGPDLRGLHERILKGEEPVGRAGALATAGPPRQLPAWQRRLYGRTAELSRLGRLLAAAGRGRGPVLVAIHGMPGVGKSALALSAAQACASRFPDGQFYVDLQGTAPAAEPRRPVDVLTRFLRTLGIPAEAVPDDEAEAAALFRSLVARRRVLVLLDDAGALDQVRPLLPAGPGCAALVTSRAVLTGLAEAVPLPLDPIPPSDSTALLAELAGALRVAAEPDAAARLGNLCGHLPLALRITSARLAARPGWPLAALADRLAVAERRLDELAVADLAVRTSIDTTCRRLAEPARLALRRLGLLRAGVFPSWALAALLDMPVAPVERTLDDLVAVHLVETEGARYRIHDLIHLYAREQAIAADTPYARAAAARRLASTVRLHRRLRAA
jgi:pentatricopeptide repeat protein